ncbi:hypothetical protein [Butyrivibrio sp. NC2002]|uniref:hypothetical protein n=1 Tax=Butyrivibrio sp. NC2002 TaxID=1410610 RepID=UPI000564D33A|nr:hypothetical protein [Butyrivibrio sp. NC2002]
MTSFFDFVTRRICSVTASSNSSKATSTLVFVATWGFFHSETMWQKVEKQQVSLISRQLVVFSAPRRCGRKLKSNKSVNFSMYLGLFVLLTRGIHSVIASPNSLKATSTPDFMATCGFFRSATLWQKVEKQQVYQFFYVLGAFRPSQEEFVLSSLLRIPQKQQVPVFSWRLGAFVVS